jgi:UDP-N-acetylmuramate--alanine ligase
VIDDYGHHPTEMAATLGAARLFGRRLVVAFQPHRFTRTRDLLKEFAPALRGADDIILTDIYAAGEAPIEGISIKRLLATFPAGSPVTHLPRKGLSDSLLPRLRPGDLLLTLGAGDITQVGSEILALLAK